MTVTCRIKCKCGCTNLESVTELKLDAGHSTEGFEKGDHVKSTVRLVCEKCKEEIRFGDLIALDKDDYFTFNEEHIELP